MQPQLDREEPDRPRHRVCARAECVLPPEARRSRVLFFNRQRTNVKPSGGKQVGNGFPTDLSYLGWSLAHADASSASAVAENADWRRSSTRNMLKTSSGIVESSGE